MDTFGEYIKELRINKGLTLRKFCHMTNLDPSNWSKIERNKLQPPKSLIVLESIALALDIEIDSEEWHTIKDLATISYMPRELLDDKSIVDKLPIFFRTVRGESPSKEELEKLIKLIKES